MMFKRLSKVVNAAFPTQFFITRGRDFVDGNFDMFKLADVSFVVVLLVEMWVRKTGGNHKQVFLPTCGCHLRSLGRGAFGVESVPERNPVVAGSPAISGARRQDDLSTVGALQPQESCGSAAPPREGTLKGFGSQAKWNRPQEMVWGAFPRTNPKPGSFRANTMARYTIPQQLHSFSLRRGFLSREACRGALLLGVGHVDAGPRRSRRHLSDVHPETRWVPSRCGCFSCPRGAFVFSTNHIWEPVNHEVKWRSSNICVVGKLPRILLLWLNTWGSPTSIHSFIHPN